jgi:hypothetical protein
MALSDMGKNDLARGVAIGAGLAILVPLAVMTLAPLARPVLRQALKTGMVALEKGREAMAELAEEFEDAAAEAEAELRAKRSVAGDDPGEGLDVEPVIDEGEGAAGRRA